MKFTTNFKTKILKKNNSTAFVVNTLFVFVKMKYIVLKKIGSKYNLSCFRKRVLFVFFSVRHKIKLKMPHKKN